MRPTMLPLLAVALALLAVTTAAAGSVEPELRSPLLAAHVVPSDEWVHVSRAAPMQMVSFSVALRHSNPSRIRQLWEQTSNPRAPGFLRYPGAEELRVLARPPAEAVAALQAWVAEEVCAPGSGRDSCRAELAAEFQDHLTVRMSAAHMEAFLGGGAELHAYTHALDAERTCVRASAGLASDTLLRRMPASLRAHVSHTRGLTHFPPLVRAHGVRKDRLRMRAVEAEGERGAPRARARSQEAAQAQADAHRRALEARINDDTAALVGMDAASGSASGSGSLRASVEDYNLLSISQLGTGDLQVQLVVQVFCSLNPLVLASYTSDGSTAWCTDGTGNTRFFEGVTLDATDANGHTQTISGVQGTKMVTTVTGALAYVPVFEVAFGLGANFAPTSLTMRLDFNFGAMTVVARYPFGVAGMAEVRPGLLKYQYGIPDDMAASNPRSKLAIGALELCAQCSESRGFYSPSDLQRFWDSNNLPGAPNVQFADFSKPLEPNDPSSPDGETQLDIQYGSGLVGGGIVSQIYHISSASQDPFNDIISGVLSDPLRPSVLSFSYGSFEGSAVGGPEDVHFINTRFQLLGLQGVSVLVSSGDDGAYMPQSAKLSDTCAQFRPTFPGSSPYVTSVGATTLFSDHPGDCPREVTCSQEVGAIITGGGGFSNLFPRPYYQEQALMDWFNSPTCSATRPSLPFNSSNRAYPDVSLFGHNYVVVESGANAMVDGTSASSPSFAAMIALFNDLRAQQGMPPLGFLNGMLYHAASTDPRTFRDVTEGSNRCLAAGRGCCNVGYTACAGFDPVTGLGSPNFRFLQAAFNVSASGDITNNYIDECKPPSSKLSGWIIAAIVLGVLAVLVLVCVCVRRHRVRARAAKPLDYYQQGVAPPMYVQQHYPQQMGYVGGHAPQQMEYVPPQPRMQQQAGTYARLN